LIFKIFWWGSREGGKKIARGGEARNIEEEENTLKVLDSQKKYIFY
jgi:hypothetical protein